MPSKAEIVEFLSREFPPGRWSVESVGNGLATIKQPIGPAELRPGGTVSGPVLMTVADISIYVAILGAIGIVPLTVTTSLNINFLRKAPADRAIIADCKLIKLGKSLAVGDVSLHSEGATELIAHAVGTYSIPRGAAARP